MRIPYKMDVNNTDYDFDTGSEEDVRQFLDNSDRIRGIADAVEAMLAEVHPNRRRIAANLRRLADKIEASQTLKATSKVTSSGVGLIGATTAVMTGTVLIMATGGIAMPIFAAAIGASCAVASAASSWGNSIAKEKWIEEIRREIAQEQEFYAVVQKRLVEIERLMTANESILYVISENMKAMGIWKETMTVVTSLIQKLLSKENLEKFPIHGFISANYNGSRMDDSKRKAYGAVAVGISAMTAVANAYNLIDGYRDFTRTEDVEKIRELADLLEQFEDALNNEQ